MVICKWRCVKLIGIGLWSGILATSCKTSGADRSTSEVRSESRVAEDASQDFDVNVGFSSKCADPMGPCDNDVGPDSSESQPDDEFSDNAEAGSLRIPPPGATGITLNQQAVLDALEEIRREFYVSRPGLGPRDVQPATDPKRCMQNAVPWWSDIVMHYYCLLPSYIAGFRGDENMRECFSNLSRRMTYEKAYEICAFVKDFQNPPPTINKTGGALGRMRWIYNNQDAVFRYIMFSEVFAFTTESQQEVLNKFYGVRLRNNNYGPRDAADIAECNAKRPTRSGEALDGTHCSWAKSVSHLSPKPGSGAAPRPAPGPTPTPGPSPAPGPTPAPSGSIVLRGQFIKSPGVGTCIVDVTPGTLTTPGVAMASFKMTYGPSCGTDSGSTYWGRSCNGSTCAYSGGGTVNLTSNTAFSISLAANRLITFRKKP